MRRGSFTLAAAVITGLLFTAALTTAPLSALATPPAVPAAPAERPIRIGLGTGLTAVDLTSSTGLVVVAGGAIVVELPAQQPAKLKLVAGKVSIDGLTTPLTPPVRLVPKAPGYVLYKNEPYRGEFEVVLGSLGRLSLVNVLNLEDYLLGVVPEEVSGGWPSEAIKAQAVAARTYALANMGRRKAEGFDLLPNSSDQAYGGMAAEVAATTAAVQATKGQVITHQGKLVATYFFSSSGGHTENNEHIWTGGSPVPYLRGVPDFDNVPENKRYSWTNQFTPAEFTERLKAAGYNVGTVTAVSPGDPGASGRPTKWSVQGSAGKATLTMQQMRTALNLNAAPRSITPVGGQTAAPVITPPPPPKQVAAPVYVVGANGRLMERKVGGSYVLSAAGQSQLPDGAAIARGAGSTAEVGKQVAVESPAPTPPPPPAPGPVTAYTVTGGGWGHGVGMSQWGAYGMAKQGKTYVQILTHFYTGTKVETR